VADEQDASKSEEPTPKRLLDAREKGQAASSQEIKSWAILLGAAIALVFMAPGISRDVSGALVRFLDSPHDMTLHVEDMQDALAALVLDIGWMVAPVLALLMVLAIAAGVMQTGLIWAPTKIKVDPANISLSKGVGKLFSAQSLMEFVKGLLKLSAVGAVSLGLALPLLRDVERLPAIEVIGTLDRVHDLAVMMTIATVAVMTAVALLDFAYQKYTFLKQMRMTKQEVRDEHKQSEGDPQVKSRIRRLRMERAQKRMMAAVPKADVIVTNPTHYSIALSYDMESMGAPKLVAKGVDVVAQRIREIAREHEIPLVENPPLARALYASVEIDQEIPPEHYQAVAQVIGYVMRLKGQAS
jgi:flagellar biosynthetic protein FlhB